MAFPIIPRRRSGTAGNPTSLNLGELAVNTLDGELYLGGDGGVMLLNGPVAAGTTTTERTGDGTTVAFTFSGYNGADDGGYLVSVGGIDQPPSKYSITNTAGGTITFVEAPVAGELISIRAIVAGGGGGGSGDATSIQGVDVATTAPTNGQVLAYNSTTDKWQPTSLNGSVTFNTAGTHQWAVPAWARWLFVNAAAGDGSDGFATNGADGFAGTAAYYDGDGNPVASTTGAAGANGTSGAGTAGASVSVAAVSMNLTGGAAGLEGTPGFGGGGAGGAGYSGVAGPDLPASAGGYGLGPYPGQGGFPDGTPGAGGGTASAGSGTTGGAGANNGGNGGDGNGGGGGGGGGDQFSGGGGGAGGGISHGYPGKGGIADTSMCAGGAGETFSGTVNFTSVAGTIIPIVISEGAGNASITISW